MRGRWLRIARWFLALSYALGAPWAAVLEYRDQVLSERFGYSSELIYLVSAIQLLCALGVLVRRFAPWSAAALSVTTVGAIVSHLEIGSPWTALPAVFYTVVQAWFGLKSRERERGDRHLSSV